MECKLLALMFIAVKIFDDDKTLTAQKRSIMDKPISHVLFLKGIRNIRIGNERSREHVDSENLIYIKNLLEFIRDKGPLYLVILSSCNTGTYGTFHCFPPELSSSLVFKN